MCLDKEAQNADIAPHHGMAETEETKKCFTEVFAVL